ncbi:trigger factor [Sporichthya polymorpha]|uniref:trigger factor n=1 Tax=Sporichthya polymorpha TaxID=35751 RepID=UPI000372C854|nr:trigger factor [Sporichthya polymorpha]
MKSAVETLNPTRVRLTVEVPFEELKPSLDAAYKKIAGQVTVPGFRKGKVPPQIIDQRFGRGAVLEEAVNNAIPQFYADAVTSAEIEVLGQPQVDVTKFEDGDELAFTAEVDVRPTIELPEYKGLAITVDPAEVTDEDIDEALTQLRSRFAAFTTVERPAEDGDYLTLDLSGATKDGEKIDEAQATGLTYVVGSKTLVEGLDDAVTGMSAGDEKTFSSKLVAGDRKDEEVDITVTVTAVKVRELPEVDDEFAQMASSFDTAEELRADTAQWVARNKKLNQGGQARDKVLETLLEQIEIPLPEAFLHNEVHFRQDSIRNQLAQAGLSLEAYLEHEGQTQEEFDADVEKRAAEAMRAQFLLDAIARTEEVTITQEEITRHLIERAQQSGMNPDQFAQQIVQAGQAQMLVAEAVRGKALAILLTSAVVTDTDGNAVDLSDLLVDGVGPAGEGDDTEAEDTEAEVAETLAAAEETEGDAPAGGAASIAIPTIPGT